MEPIQPPTPEATEFPPVPASPAGVPGIPPSEGELSQEQMKANLKEMMDKITPAYQGFSSQKEAVDQTDEEQKKESLRQLFDLFQSKGIDPSDPAAVKAYLDKIRESNPELYQQVESALQILLGEEGESLDSGLSEESPVEEATEVPTSDNMNINTDGTTPEGI